MTTLTSTPVAEALRRLHHQAEATDRELIAQMTATMSTAGGSMEDVARQLIADERANYRAVYSGYADHFLSITPSYGRFLYAMVRACKAERIVEFGTSMGQVQASKWSRDRFVMVGDAAYCPTPFTGEGTALGLVGAYVLAGEIKRGADHADAFGTYEKLVRPYVEASQKRMSPTFIRVLHVKSRLGISFTRMVQKFFASGIVQRLLKPSDAKRQKEIAKDFAFPSYS